jgi:hypothetical protein
MLRDLQNKTYPKIQMIAPKAAKIRDMNAKGRPNKNSSGLQSPISEYF